MVFSVHYHLFPSSAPALLGFAHLFSRSFISFTYGWFSTFATPPQSPYLSFRFLPPHSCTGRFFFLHQSTRQPPLSAVTQFFPSRTMFCCLNLVFVVQGPECPRSVNLTLFVAPPCVSVWIWDSRGRSARYGLLAPRLLAPQPS